jgi:surfeit locus 1 family protein
VAMAAALHAPRPAPVFLAAETTTNPELPSLIPAPIPADIPNNHFAYMLTWFGLAAGLAGVYLAMLFGRRSS